MSVLITCVSVKLFKLECAEVEIGVRSLDALLFERTLVQLKSDESEYRQYEDGEYSDVAQPTDRFH